MRAYVLIREQPHYRRDAFAAGLRDCGYKVLFHPPAGEIAPNDALLIWNRYGTSDLYARQFDKVGAPVFVAENGYIKADEPTYALALDHHNGAGRWFVGAAPRPIGVGPEFDGPGLRGLKPWALENRAGHIVLLNQRGIGEPGLASPPNLVEQATARLRNFTKRAIKVRHHPGGPTPPTTTLEQDLAGAWAAVTWSSASALQALIQGVPVFYMAPKWIGQSAACGDLSRIEQPVYGDRYQMLTRVTWAQWTVSELATGEPFRCLAKVR